MSVKKQIQLHLIPPPCLCIVIMNRSKRITVLKAPEFVRVVLVKRHGLTSNIITFNILAHLYKEIEESPTLIK
jgi:hypothetical protein